ncbi:hypothetical protein SAMN05192558_103519 [Actinokineospora alba]|uniref:Uncharacterized protein n=1 Tax=Actinokineospora alba TaxID=504798 RepID=A0A1H0KKQ0_9PSEU|nr:hypothetical protein C8E96_3423 [Actinokineospora alba]SDH87904.1 hypothetical protein SAMN05421871_102530 [Actinokineospora alba]SDO56340.1 hypothetical protein SAMN05192558_103519 [Actinokineospora alba]
MNNREVQPGMARLPHTEIVGAGTRRVAGMVEDREGDRNVAQFVWHYE